MLVVAVAVVQVSHDALMAFDVDDCVAVTIARVVLCIFMSKSIFHIFFEPLLAHRTAPNAQLAETPWDTTHTHTVTNIENRVVKISMQRQHTATSSLATRAPAVAATRSI